MMYYARSGYIIFSLRKLKFYEGWGTGAGSWGPEAGYEDRVRGWMTQTPFSFQSKEII